MIRKSRIAHITAAAMIGCCLAGAAQAQNRGFLNWTPGTFAVNEGRVGLGIGMAPDYLGSDDMTAIPLPSFAFSIGRIPIQNNLLGVEIDIRPGFLEPANGRAFLAYGPILRYNMGGNDFTQVQDPAVALTTPVAATPEIGGFIEAALPLLGGSGPPTILTARFAVLQATQSFDGASADLTLGMVRPLGRWTLGGGVGASWADDKSTRAFFDVSAADQAASGLPTYTASGGLLTMGASLFASYAITERWSVNALAGYTMIMGSAADSPIVTDAGQPQQAFVGLGLNWKF